MINMINDLCFSTKNQMNHSFVIFKLPHIDDFIIVRFFIKLHGDVKEGQYTHL